MSLPVIPLKFLVAIIAFNVLVVLFFWGPLLPWSPITIGYTATTFDHYRVLYPTDSELPEFYRHLDTKIDELTTKLALSHKRDITVIRSNKSSLRWYIPWASTDSLGGATLQTGTVVYINHEKITEEGLKEEEFVDHELIHALSHQHSSLLDSFRGGGVTYVSEGLPMALAGPNYLNEEAFTAELSKVKVNLAPADAGNLPYEPVSFATLNESSGERYRFMQELYGKFMSYLMETYGQAKFNVYYQAFLKDPDNHRQVFQKYYGSELPSELEKFKQTLH